jgi:hypothetical protein
VTVAVGVGECDSNSNEGSPGISRFSVFYCDVRSDRDANRGRFFLWENVNASINDEWAFAMRIVRRPHFLQTFAGKSNLVIRRRPLGGIFDDVTLRAVAEETLLSPRRRFVPFYGATACDSVFAAQVRSVPVASVDWARGGSAPLICHAVFRTDLVATLWRYADVISLESFAPHITLHAGVGAVSAGGPALSRLVVFLLDQSARFRSHANVIGRSRLSPDVARRAHVAVARGLRH